MIGNCISAHLVNRVPPQIEKFEFWQSFCDCRRCHVANGTATQIQIHAHGEVLGNGVGRYVTDSGRIDIRGSATLNVT